MLMHPIHNAPTAVAVWLRGRGKLDLHSRASWRAAIASGRAGLSYNCDGVSDVHAQVHQRLKFPNSPNIIYFVAICCNNQSIP